MAFVEEWQTGLEDSLAAFAQLATSTDGIDFTYGILAAAAVWPIRRALQDYDSDAIAAVRQVSASKGKALQLILKVIEEWNDDRLAAAESLATATATAPELRLLLDRLIAHFDAGTRFSAHLVQAHLSSASSGQVPGQTFEIAEQIKAALVNIGGFTNIQALTVHLNLPETSTILAPIELKPFEPKTVDIPAGAFLMGSLPGKGVPEFEMPQHEVFLPAYRIGRYPVTNKEYAEFLNHETHQDVPGTKEWWNRQPPKEKAHHPVVGVSWKEALDYCVWLSARTGRSYRLPTEAEWEKAARGTVGQCFPWGDEWKEERCNSASDSTTPVGRYSPSGDSPYGCADMLGNVQEWTQTRWGSDRTSPTFVYPYRTNDGREDVSDDTSQARDEYLVHRGGSYRNRPEELRCAARGVSKPSSRIRWRGFRVLLEK